MIVTAVLTLLLVLPDAPEGFLTAKNEEEGFVFHYPQTYKEVPTRPGDSVVVASYARLSKPAPPKSNSRVVPAPVKVGEIWIVSIDKRKAAPAPEPGEAPPDTTGSTTASSAASGPRTEAEELEERLRADSFEELVRKRLDKWSIESKTEKTDGKVKRTEYALTYPGKGLAEARGVAWMFDRGDRILGLVGFYEADGFEAARRAFEKSALSLKEIEISEAATKEMERYYARRPELVDSAFRIERRKDLPHGWKSIDTRNYLIVHHTKDDHLLTQIQNDLEALRVLYEQLFPPVRPIEAASVVRVCKDRQEYLQYGGNPSSAGYWNSAARELVVYDNVKGQQGSRLGNRDSYITLYHEAFHQYIHYSAGELPPHSWFNEGYGDYFSGAKIYASSTKVHEIGPNPWRLPAIKAIVEQGKFIPLARVIRAEQPEFYSQPAIFYAEAWSFIYFLNKSSIVQSNQAWASILPRYFDALKSAYAAELARFEKDATLAQKQEAGKRARAAALEKAFEGVDLEALSDAWEKFVKKLR